MKASETRLIKIIDGTNQYVVPYFQRPYTWQRKTGILFGEMSKCYSVKVESQRHPVITLWVPL
jgi:hypothetical protein